MHDLASLSVAFGRENHTISDFDLMDEARPHDDERVVGDPVNGRGNHADQVFLCQHPVFNQQFHSFFEQACMLACVDI